MVGQNCRRLLQKWSNSFNFLLLQVWNGSNIDMQLPQCLIKAVATILPIHDDSVCERWKELARRVWRTFLWFWKWAELDLVANTEQIVRFNTRIMLALGSVIPVHTWYKHVLLGWLAWCKVFQWTHRTNFWEINQNIQFKQRGIHQRPHHQLHSDRREQTPLLRGATDSGIDDATPTRSCSEHPLSYARLDLHKWPRRLRHQFLCQRQIRSLERKLSGSLYAKTGPESRSHNGGSE